MKVLFGLVALVLLATPVFACNGHGALMPDGSVVPIVGDDAAAAGGILVVDQAYVDATGRDSGFAVNYGGTAWYYFYDNPAQNPPPVNENQNVDYNG